MKRTAALIWLVLHFVCIPALARSTTTSRPVYLHITAQPLRDALTRWSKKTGVSIGFDPDVDIEGVVAPRMWGWFEPNDALGRLLAEAGLRAEWSTDTLVIVKLGIRPSHSDAKGSDVDTAAKVTEVQITGTHIPEAQIGFNPLISYSRTDIDRIGSFATDEFAQALIPSFGRINPQTTVGNGTSLITAANVAHGQALDLFALGAGATLVLVDGQRISPSGHDGSISDISMLPLSAVDHIDILPDAASAIYGGDAIAGVVNFVLRRKFSGFETTPYYGFTADGGGRELGFSQLAGGVWSSGNALVTYENYRQQAVAADSRENLVPTPLFYQVVPAQLRRSAALTAEQSLASWIDLSVMGYYSSRHFSQAYTTFPALTTLSEGNTRVSGGTIAANLSLMHDWGASISAGFSGEKEKGATTVSGYDQSFNTHSDYYTLDLRSKGPLFSLPAGYIQLSIGLSWRLETFNDLISRLGPTGSGLARNVLGVYTEMLVPLVSDQNDLPLVKRLAMSLAVRWDEYENRDSGLLNARAVNPKLALLWSPGLDFTFRGTYTPSAFRVAPLAQIGGLNPALLTPFSSPISGSPEINTLYLTGGNNSLQPEYATSYTLGFDWKPARWPDWSFSGSYLHVHYRDRISVPPVVGPVTGAFSQLTTLSPYANLSPTTAEVEAIYARDNVQDPMGIGQSAVGAIFDGRYLNIDVLNASGIETTALGKVALPLGDLNLRLDGQYLTQLSNQATQTAPYASIVRSVFNPPDFRIRSDIWWTRSNWLVGITADYTGSFKDTAVPGNAHVPSWLVFDARVALEIPEKSSAFPERKTTLSLSAVNFTNRNPPHLATVTGRPLNYDPSNASPLGCQIRLEVKQRW